MINFISISLILISMFYTFRWSINKPYIDNTFDLLCSSIKNTCFLYLYNEDFVVPYIDEANIEYVIESYLNLNYNSIARVRSNLYQYASESGCDDYDTVDLYVKDLERLWLVRNKYSRLNQTVENLYKVKGFIKISIEYYQGGKDEAQN